MDKMIKKVRKELDSIQHLINDVENKNLREHFKRSVKKIRKELSEFSKNESLHLVSHCPLCNSDNLHQYKMHHIHCKDCKENFDKSCD